MGKGQHQNLVGWSGHLEDCCEGQGDEHPAAAAGQRRCALSEEHAWNHGCVCYLHSNIALHHCISSLHCIVALYHCVVSLHCIIALYHCIVSSHCEAFRLPT